MDPEKQERVTEFTISRKEWLHGEGGSDSCLYRQRDGKRCCLGIYGKACGVPDTHMASITTPRILNETIHKLPEQMRWLIGENTNRYSTGDVMIRNDWPLYEGFTQTDRELIVVEFFAAQGIKVTFTD